MEVKKIYQYIVPTLVLLFLGILGCSKLGLQPSSDDEAPVIDSLNSDIYRVHPLQIVHFQCSARDDQSKSLRYQWSASDGDFLDNSGDKASAVWQAPDHETNVAVKVLVSDGYNFDEKGTILYVRFAYNNNSPRIESFTFSSDSISISDSLRLECFAVDPDSDALIFHWTAEAGYFTSPDTLPVVEWHPPDTVGTYQIRLSVSDGTVVSERTHQIKVSGYIGNTPPDVPQLIYPGDGAVDIGESTELRWSCSDVDEDPSSPTGDVLTYNIYLDTESGTTFYRHIEDATRLQIDGLIPNTVYKWKVVARDKIGNTTSSPIASFQVGASRIDRLKQIFPLAVGNTWTFDKMMISESNPPFERDTTYTQTTITVTESALGMLPDPDQPAYHVVGPPLVSTWYAYSDSGVIHLDNDQWVLYGPTYHYPLPAGTTISYFNDGYLSRYKRVVDDAAEIVVNGITYSNCYEYVEGSSSTSPMANDSYYAVTVYLVPGLGLVRHVLYSGESSYYGYSDEKSIWDLRESSVQVPH